MIQLIVVDTPGDRRCSVLGPTDDGKVDGHLSNGQPKVNIRRVVDEVNAKNTRRHFAIVTGRRL